MSTSSDLLYSIFEQYLLNAIVEEETSDEFLTRVVREYLSRLSANGGTIPHDFAESIECDLRDEVQDMLRKKTYGHYNLTEFRRAHAAVPQSGKAPARGRRIC